jgi:hypothetical protein
MIYAVMYSDEYTTGLLRLYTDFHKAFRYVLSLDLEEACYYIMVAHEGEEPQELYSTFHSFNEQTSSKFSSEFTEDELDTINYLKQ